MGRLLWGLVVGIVVAISLFVFVHERAESVTAHAGRVVRPTSIATLPLAGGDPATLPPMADGDVVRVALDVKDETVEIAPGVLYRAWTFDGSVPAPVLHVRQGQTIEASLTNHGSMPHSLDFHAARVNPARAFRDIAPGQTTRYRFTATDPGVFLYHCFTTPMMAHVANGMYGALIVEPKKALPQADRQYVLVGGEWYYGDDASGQPMSLDYNRALGMRPSAATFNGNTHRYVAHPLPARPGETVRFWIVAAGPSYGIDFHVVGSVIKRAWVDGDMTRYEQGVQTVHVPAGGGAVADVEFDTQGLYPVVNHEFALSELGQVAVVRVGDAKGTILH
jgi:nitrite reductase (NO-forming)